MGFIQDVPPAIILLLPLLDVAFIAYIYVVATGPLLRKEDYKT